MIKTIYICDQCKKECGDKNEGNNVVKKNDLGIIAQQIKWDKGRRTIDEFSKHLKVKLKDVFSTQELDLIDEVA